MELVPMCLSRDDASTDMPHDLFGSSRDLDIRSISKLTFQGRHVYISICLERNTMVPKSSPYHELFESYL